MLGGQVKPVQVTDESPQDQDVPWEKQVRWWMALPVAVFVWKGFRAEWSLDRQQVPRSQGHQRRQGDQGRRGPEEKPGVERVLRMQSGWPTSRRTQVRLTVDGVCCSRLTCPCLSGIGQAEEGRLEVTWLPREWGLVEGVRSARCVNYS